MKTKIVVLVLLNSIVLASLAYVSLNNAEFISALQAIILAITVGVIWWYTEETQRIRIATLQQNEIMGDQLRVMQENVAFQNQKEKSLVQPIFQQAGYESSADEANLRFKNLGAIVTNLSAETTAKCEVSISRTSVPTNEKFTVHLKKIRGITGGIEIKILYDDQHAQPGSKRFTWSDTTGTKEVR